MGMIYRKSGRDMLKNKSKFIATMLVIALGSMCYTGFTSAGDIEENYINDYYSEHNLPDGWLCYSDADEDSLDEIRDMEGVKDAELRYSYDFNVEKDGRESTVSLTSCREDTSIGTPVLREGHLPEKPGEVAFDEEYSAANDIRPGDDVTVKLMGREMEARVTGTVQSVEHLMKIQGGFTDIPDYEAYGIGFISYDSFEDELDGMFPANEIVIDTEDPGRAPEVLEDIRGADQDGFLYAVSRDMDPSYSLFQGRIDYCDSIAAICPVMFYLVAALMIIIIMGNMVESQRNQIGLMKALGISSGRIAAHYVFNGVFISVAGVVIGGAAGSYLVPKFMLYAISKQFDLPGLEIVFHLENLIPSILMMSGFAAAVILLLCRKILKQSATTAMRPPSARTAGRLMIERIDCLWRRLSMDWRLMFRNVFINKRRTVMSILGIVGSLGILITAFGLNDAMKKLTELQYTDIMRCSAVVDLNREVDDHDLEDIDEDVDMIRSSSVPFRMEDTDDEYYTSIMTFDGDEKGFYGILDRNDGQMDIPDEGLLISQKTAETFGLEKGDTVKMRTMDPSMDREVIEAEIAGISWQYYTQEMYCTSSYLESLGIDASMKKLFVNYDPKEFAKSDVEKMFSDMPETEAVTFTADLEEDLLIYTKNIYLVVLSLVVISMLISFAVISSVSAVNYTERLGSLALMKTMGHSDRKIYALFARENIFITVTGAILGIPAGLAVFRYVLTAESTDLCAFPFPDVGLNILVSCILLVVFTLIANVTVMRKIKKLDVIKLMKEIE